MLRLWLRAALLLSGLCLAGLIVVPALALDSAQLVYTSRRTDNADLYLRDVWRGLEFQLTDDPGDDDSPAWSPDGRWIVFVSDRTDNNELYIIDAYGRRERRLTNHNDADYMPAWSPDGRQIAFVSGRDEDMEIYLLDVLTDDLRRLTDNARNDYAPAWFTRDGRMLLAYTFAADGHTEVRALDLATGQDTLLIGSEQLRYTPAFSPDSTHVAFPSRRTAYNELYIMLLADVAPNRFTPDGADLPVTPLTFQMNINGPAWSPDGRWIAFESPANRIADVFIVEVASRRLRAITRSPAASDYDARWRPTR